MYTKERYQNEATARVEIKMIYMTEGRRMKRERWWKARQQESPEGFK